MAALRQERRLGSLQPTGCRQLGAAVRETVGLNSAPDARFSQILGTSKSYTEMYKTKILELSQDVQPYVEKSTGQQ